LPIVVLLAAKILDGQGFIFRSWFAASMGAAGTFGTCYDNKWTLVPFPKCVARSFSSITAVAFALMPPETTRGDQLGEIAPVSSLKY
jgi:hypothetical protein